MEYLVNFIAIAFVVLLVFLAVNFRKTESYSDLKSKASVPFEVIQEGLGVVRHNISVDTSPERKKPLTTIKNETFLSDFAPGLFGTFDQNDWDKFWDLIYKPIKVKEGFFEVKKFRTEKELKEILSERYPETFSNFTEGVWGKFWDIVFAVE